jgi:hypothetical protein
VSRKSCAGRRRLLDTIQGPTTSQNTTAAHHHGLLVTAYSTATAGIAPMKRPGGRGRSAAPSRCTTTRDATGCSRRVVRPPPGVDSLQDADPFVDGQGGPSASKMRRSSISMKKVIGTANGTAAMC